MAGQLSIETSLGAANSIATVKAILTISHKRIQPPQCLDS